MISVKFYYTNGTTLVKKFQNVHQAMTYGMMEGDHVVSWEILKKCKL